MGMPPTLRPSPEAGATIRVRVQPRAAREGIEGSRAGAWRVRVSAAPVEGEANRALMAVLARALGVRPAELRIVHGARGRDKLVRIEGVRAEEVERRLAAACPGGDAGR